MDEWVAAVKFVLFSAFFLTESIFFPLPETPEVPGVLGMGFWAGGGTAGLTVVYEACGEVIVKNWGG